MIASLDGAAYGRNFISGVFFFKGSENTQDFK